MGKRSNFKRRARDNYSTPPEAVDPLLPHLIYTEFYEPCVGKGRLANYLISKGYECKLRSDLYPKDKKTKMADARGHNFMRGGLNHPCFITNPPWGRKVLHPIIENLSSQGPTWLLIDSDWMHTKQSAPYMDRCALIVSIGRVKWIRNSRYTGKDNCCWYLFRPGWKGGPRFIGRKLEKKK